VRTGERSTHRRRRPWGAAGAALVLLGAVSACGSSGDRGDEAADAPEEPTDDLRANELEGDAEARDGGTLRVGLNAETDGWNPGIARWADAGSLVGGTMFEPLMAFDADGQLQPNLAASVTPNDDHTEWTIEVKPDITFHDGSELTAEIVADNLNFYSHGPTLSRIVNDALVGEARAEGPLTVVVPLNLSWAAYAAGLAGSSAVMMHPSMLSEANGYGNTDPIGTGPFKFVEWQQDRQLVVERFADYRKEGEPHLDSIEFEVVVDPITRAAGLSTTTFDMIFSSQVSVVEEFRDDEDYVIVSDFESEQSFVQLNTSTAPFDNLDARRALAFATDRDALIETMGDGILTRTDDPLDGSWSVEDPGYVEHDPAEAEAAIERYKAATGEDTLSFRFSGLANDEERTLMNLLSDQWKQVGIEVEVEFLEQTVFVSEAVGGAFEAQSFRGFANADPDWNYPFWHSSTATPPLSINFTQFKDDALDEALEAGRRDPDPAARQDAYDDAVRIINEAFTHIWLYNTPYSLVASKDVRGLDGPRTIPLGGFLPKTWWGEVWLDRA
jgi:peptide/nickel transport system substrate-binding protein